MEMGLNTLESGKTISKTELVNSNGLMVRSMRDSIATVLKMEKEFLNLLIKATIKENSLSMKFMVKVYNT